MNRAPLRRPAVFAALSIFIGLASGCSSLRMPDLGAARFHETVEVPADRVITHKACQEVLEDMDYVRVSGSPGTGALEMATRIQPGGAALLPRQRRAVVSVSKGDTGGSFVKIGFWEDSEDARDGTAVSASGRLIHGGVLYDLFWERLAAELPKAQEEEPLPEKPADWPESSPAVPAAPAPPATDP